MSADTMTLTPINTDGSLWTAQAVTVNRPRPGYECEIHMVIESVKSHLGDWHFFDNDSTGATDYRICNMQLDLPASDKVALNGLIAAHGWTYSGTEQGARCLPFQLSIDSGLSGGIGSLDPSDGFYPFGPDVVFSPCTVWLIKHDQGGALWQPLKYFEDKLSMLLVPPLGGIGALARNANDGPSQGGMSLAGVSGLMFPQDGFKAKSVYAMDVGVSIGGQASGIDATTDQYETSFTFTGNLGKAALLAAALTNSSTGRKSNIAFSSGDGWPFGADNGEAYSGNVKLLGSEKAAGEIVLKITHESYNRFTMPLSLYKI